MDRSLLHPAMEARIVAFCDSVDSSLECFQRRGRDDSSKYRRSQWQKSRRRDTRLPRRPQQIDREDQDTFDAGRGITDCFARFDTALHLAAQESDSL